MQGRRELARAPGLYSPSGPQLGWVRRVDIKHHTGGKYIAFVYWVINYSFVVSACGEN